MCHQLFPGFLTSFRLTANMSAAVIGFLNSSGNGGSIGVISTLEAPVLWITTQPQSKHAPLSSAGVSVADVFAEPHEGQ